MNKLPFFLTLCITLIGCVPSTLTSTEQPQFERPFTDTSLSATQTAEATPNPAPRAFITPPPARQILDNTSWVLKYAIMDGERIELKAHEMLEIYFRPGSVELYDGCNQMSYGFAGGRPGYIATEHGEFSYPLQEPGEEGAYGIVRASTALYCFHIDEESGEKIEIGVPDFLPPYEEIVTYELSADQLRLYYPEDRRNNLVFERLEVGLHPTAEPTITAYPGPTTTAEATVPVPYPGPPTVTSTPLPPYP